MGLLPAREGKYSRGKEHAFASFDSEMRAYTNAVQAPIDAKRCRRRLIAICRPKKRSDGNQKTDCRRNGGLVRLPPAGNNLSFGLTPTRCKPKSTPFQSERRARFPPRLLLNKKQTDRQSGN